MRHLTRMSRNLSRWGGGFTYLYLSLMLLCFSAIGVKAADINGSVKFNSGVRYSQWAINSRAHDFYANTTSFGLATYNADGTVKEPRNDNKKKLDYVPGLVAKSMIEAADYYQGFDWSKPWFLSVKEYGDAYDTLIPENGTSFDDLNGTKIYIGINSNNYASADDKKMVTTALASVKQGFIKANNTYVIPQGTLAENAGKNVAGGWWHKSTYKNQMWLDGAYMGSALLAQLTQFYGNSGNVFGSKEADWNMVAKQLNIVWDMCWNSTDKLMYHAFDATATAKATDKGTATWYGLSSTKPYNFHSAAYWGRANAWYLYALVDVLEAMEADGQKGTTNYTTLKGHLDELAAGIAARQDAKNTGGWFQLLDKDGSFVSKQYNGTTKNYANYIETSATALFSAALFKAVRLGLLSTSPYDYKTVAAKAFEGLVNNFVTYDADGGIQIWGSCKSAGLSGKNFRDGSNEYYLSGSDVTMVKKGETTEGKVLGGFIMAATEYERAYQNQDSKQILFAKDLAPSYDFTTTAGTLDATAYGSGDVTYQWYKNNAKITDATSATYTPTESGSYYCIATSATNSRSAGGNSIQTSTTTVTTANTDNGSTDNNGGSDNGNTGNNVGTSDILSATVVAGKTLSIATQTSQDLTADYITIKGGTATLYNGNKTKSAEMISSKEGIKLNGSSASYMKITLEKPLAKGDVITATSTSELYLTKDATKATNINLNSNPYTIPEGSNLIGAKVFYLWYGKFTAIKITRANTQVDLTASFSPATISAKEGDIAQNLPTLTVKAGETTLTANDYTVTYASDNNAVAKVENGKVSFVGEGETNIVATIKPTDTNKYKETSATFAVKVEKKQTPVTPTESGVIYDFTGSIGTTTAGTSCTTANNVITFSSNFSANEGKYITIKPKTVGFKAGDVITLKGYCNSKNLSGVIIYSDVNGSSIFKSNILATSAAGGSEFTYTIEKDCDALYLGRYGGGTTCLTSLQVERPASSSNKTRLTASFERNADVVVNTTKTATLPTLTVKAGENILAANQYDVVYKSNAENVATLSDNTITIKNLGIATITAIVTPKNTDTYEGTTATYQLSVKAPSPLVVSAMDVTINTTDAEEEQPIIKVYGDNDKLLKLDQDYTLSYAVSGDNNVSVDASGKFSVNKNAEKTEFIKGTSLITVTATPTESLRSNYTEGKLQFSYSVSEGKIKPVFSDSFKGITINLHQDNKNRTITVPLIYNGEDVSSYFIYTYTITPTGNTSSVTDSTLNFTPETAGTYTVTVSATPGSNGTDNYSDVYDSPDAITFTLNVDSKYQVISVTPDPTSITMYAGTTHEAPDLTVKNETTTLGDTEYEVTWFSTSPGVVKVDAKTGKIEAVSEGTANIRVVVTGKNLESTTALITVEVDDRALYRVKGPEKGETYGNQKRMWNQAGTLSVVLGGWMFPNDGTPDSKILANETLSNGEHYQWDKTSSKAKWKLTGFDYYVSGNNSKNARQENGSNAMPETTTIGTADFKKYTTEVKDPMFNVPCSGSFLVFNPKTNGKVTAHIFQNGVFDTSGKKHSYRPQRRVFVMDEAGNFVTSTAHIESTNGKPTGGTYDLTAYGWDLNGGKAPTETEVASHFDGLESFVMTEDGFKNNVYPSALSDDIMPNNKAIKNHPNEKSAHGWCVLADSPVTYTFNVKAGKTYYLYNFGSKIGFYGFSFDEGETKPTVDYVNYDAETANANNTVAKTADGHVAQVKIARKMVANRWTTCVLPFSLNKHQVDAIFGATYSIDNKEGTQILYFDHVEGSKAYFVRHAYNTIVAGKPFLIKPTKEVTSINTADVKAYPYVTIENTEPAKWCESNGYVWTSSYNTMKIAKNDYFIGASDGKFKAYSAASGTVKGFRGFLKANNLPAGAKPGMLSISTSSITDGNDGETTGIEDLIITTDGELMPANSRVYNINGQLVSEDASSFQSLPSGIYIINGKKYIK